MRLIDRLLDRDDEPDAWAVRHRRPDSPGWRSVEGLDELDAPLEQKEFEWNHPDLEAGTYRLFALDGGQLRRPPAEVAWTVRVDGAAADRPDRDDEVRAELRELRAALEGSRAPEDFDDALKRSAVSAYLEGDISLDEIRSLASISNMFNGSQRRLSDAVDDPKDLGEIAGRGLLTVADELQERGFTLSSLTGDDDEPGLRNLEGRADRDAGDGESSSRRDVVDEATAGFPGPDEEPDVDERPAARDLGEEELIGVADDAGLLDDVDEVQVEPTISQEEARRVAREVAGGA